MPYSAVMNGAKDLTFDQLLELLAEHLAKRLCREPGRLLPRLLTIEQAAGYLGLTIDATRGLTAGGTIPAVRAERQVFLDRLDLDRWIDEHKTGWV